MKVRSRLLLRRGQGDMEIRGGDSLKRAKNGHEDYLIHSPECGKNISMIPPAMYARFSPKGAGM
jgi:hypothetical protein